MNELVLYLVKSLVAGALFFAVYQLAIRRESYLHFSRIYLLASVLLMVILPLIGSILPMNLIHGANQPPLPLITLPEVVITGGRLINPEQEQQFLGWASVGYLIITLAMLTGLMMSILRILRFYRSVDRAEKLRNNIYLIPEAGSPFSFLGKIFVSPKYADHPSLESILIHENTHIRQRHGIDLIFLELFSCIFWFNPFFFLIKRAMREVHEYLADREVIREGKEPVAYQQLLFSEVSGNPQYIIANNFNLLTKKRIIMLLKKSSRAAAWRIGALVPLVLVAALSITLLQSEVTGQTVDQKAVPATPAVPAADMTVAPVPPVPPSPPVPPVEPQNPVPPAKKVKPQKEVSDKAKDKSGKEVFTMVEVPPQFPGGEEARVDYMVHAIKYPEEARKKGVQGTVYISFVIEEDGSITNAEVLRGIGGGCDEEALRVIREMPKWTPGKQKGKPVRVQFNMPIKFTLSEGKGKK